MLKMLMQLVALRLHVFPSLAFLFVPHNSWLLAHLRCGRGDLFARVFFKPALRGLSPAEATAGTWTHERSDPWAPLGNPTGQVLRC